MRLWTLHPKYLDAKGLVALWREALLAQAVLKGETRGYRHHPQLQRFRAQVDPVAAIATYLAAVQAQAQARGYRFDETKIDRRRMRGRLTETRGQLDYEWRHLRRKLAARSPEWLAQWRHEADVEAHPLFRPVAGAVRDWERIAAPKKRAGRKAKL